MKLIRILWGIIQADVMNRMARLTGLVMTHTHKMTVEERLWWRMRMKG